MKSLVCLTGLLCLASTAVVYAKHKDENPCNLLQLDITNASGTNAKLMGDPEYSRVHGYIERRGQPVIPNGQTTIWTMHDNPFAGPTGTIIYTWKGGTKSCVIHYDQSFCGPIRGGTNRTHVDGSCSVVNDSGKPSKYWHLSGESQITLGDTD